MFKTIFVSARSLSFELCNTDIYFPSAPFDVFVNGLLCQTAVNTNVFSVFGLDPATDYHLRVGDFEQFVRTDSETAFLDVHHFGAQGDGISDDTRAIQDALLSCPKGGTVFVPAGVYSVCPLFLKSGQTLYLDKNAVLLGNTNRSNYPILPSSWSNPDGSQFELTSWEGESQPAFASLVTGICVQDVKIVGPGTIDANAQNADWWQYPRECRGGGYRPNGIFLSHCERIGLQGITICNTPAWNLHPYLSHAIDFIDLRVQSPKDSPNTDGCNPECCDGVRIIGVDFSVGDDCIAIKSGKYAFAKKYGIPASNTLIRNCRMAFGHGAVVLGSEMSGGIKSLSVSQCFFDHTDRGLRIKTRRGRGKTGIIDGVVFENIRMDHVLTPLVMNMYYFCDEDGKTEYVWSKEKWPIDDRTPYLGRFTFRNMVCENVHVAAGYFYGLPEQPIKSITLENIRFTYANDAKPGYPAMMSFIEPMKKAGLQFRYVGEVNLKNVVLDHPEGEPVFLEAVSAYKCE